MLGLGVRVKLSDMFAGVGLGCMGWVLGWVWHVSWVNCDGLYGR